MFNSQLERFASSLHEKRENFCWFIWKEKNFLKNKNEAVGDNSTIIDVAVCIRRSKAGESMEEMCVRHVQFVDFCWKYVRYHIQCSFRMEICIDWFGTIAVRLISSVRRYSGGVFIFYYDFNATQNHRNN